MIIIELNVEKKQEAFERGNKIAAKMMMDKLQNNAEFRKQIAKAVTK
jgi:hypothetical protein